MKERTMTVKSSDGRWIIEQERVDEFYVITIYKDGRTIFSANREHAEPYSELAKTLGSYIRMFG